MPGLDQERGGQHLNRRLLRILTIDQDSRRERPEQQQHTAQRMRRTRWPDARRSAAETAPQQRRCLACLCGLSNGALVCCDACDELAWRIVPTLSGKLWAPAGAAAVPQTPRVSAAEFAVLRGWTR